jgi:hypothetical protein
VEISWSMRTVMLGDAAVVVHPTGCTPTKETRMRRLAVSTALLVLVVGVSLVPRALARTGGGGAYAT